MIHQRVWGRWSNLSLDHRLNKKDGSGVFTSSHLVRTEYPGCGRCHLVQLMLFGARFCAIATRQWSQGIGFPPINLPVQSWAGLSCPSWGFFPFLEHKITAKNSRNFWENLFLSCVTEEEGFVTDIAAHHQGPSRCLGHNLVSAYLCVFPSLTQQSYSWSLGLEQRPAYLCRRERLCECLFAKSQADEAVGTKWVWLHLALFPRFATLWTQLLTRRLNFR